jgi:hypothetical protein
MHCLPASPLRVISFNHFSSVHITPPSNGVRILRRKTWFSTCVLDRWKSDVFIVEFFRISRFGHRPVVCLHTRFYFTVHPFNPCALLICLHSFPSQSASVYSPLLFSLIICLYPALLSQMSTPCSILTDHLFTPCSILTYYLFRTALFSLIICLHPAPFSLII